jgi:hypothetical protein
MESRDIESVNPGNISAQSLLNSVTANIGAEAIDVNKIISLKN